LFKLLLRKHGSGKTMILGKISGEVGLHLRILIMCCSK